MAQTHELKAAVREILEQPLRPEEAAPKIIARLRELTDNSGVDIDVAVGTTTPPAAVIRIGRGTMFVEI